jgi:3'-phosphoadenosine 5'-phosphosulfate sulfotransferase (PAPS reductase)/FAD synthetase
MQTLTVSCFSAGGSSAVAAKLLADKIDRLLYIHIDDQHEDTMRFVRECQEWFKKPVEILQSPLMTVENACLSAGGSGYINGPGGAACTKRLKRDVRKRWEYELPQDIQLRYVWGMDCNEAHRAERIIESMPNQQHIFPLVEKGITKEHAHEIIAASGIKRPAMYDLGYSNNNCIGCVKGGKGYWNKIRTDFPEVFKARAAMERTIQATCIKGVYLDELDPAAGRDEKPIVGDCGILCELMAI